jgi:CheY-like chemotaxis protein
VELDSTPAELVLTVTDSGKGISAEFLPHVFDRFRQQDDSTSRRHSGLGLGLALVRHLVMAHGGDVTAHSEGEGRGAAFRIRLPFDASRPLRAPASVAPPRAPAARGPAIGELSNVTVLVVEDDVDSRELIVTVLAQQGAAVTWAGNADDALVELGRARHDVLVSDVGLPGADGFELLRRVRERHSPEELPAIALTAYARPEDRDLSREAGFQAHLAKPASPAALVQLVGQVVGRRTTTR